ncbi:hypothetical protein MBCUT_10050 [Methanobrevibacter cuticularis]|uniref:Uncharacterized protein n=1 Tax=Methanobrevibacter cuticularis TaxID=47311 RepID=A0A166E098_9EURY|nr:hypothetical protein [Methanobrevibacter cuticularis]KZX16139.1 hypothetical protein MBCUT_10050 [Methanobrevibacter cuticularis]
MAEHEMKLKVELNYNSGIHYAKETGKKEGINEDKTEGMEKSKINAVHRMKEDNLPNDKIKQ